MLEELAVGNQETHQHSNAIRDSSRSISANMEQNFVLADRQRDDSNLVLQTLSLFRLGDGQLETVTDKLMRHRAEIERELTALAASGVDIFDRNYTPIPNTNPPKHDVVGRCLPRTHSAAPGQMGSARQGRPAVSSVDNHGYLPVSNAASQPPAGDPKVDAVKSNFKRCGAEQDRAGKSEQLQIRGLGTFILPGTDTAIFVQFVPLTVNGRHWGSLSAGVLPQALLQQH